MENSLHVSYTPKLLTQRKRHVLSLFIKRFYTPYVMFVWFLTALDITHCFLVKIYVPLLTVISAFHVTRQRYIDWYKDLLVILEANKVKLTTNNRLYFWISELVLQSLVFLLSVWFVDDIHLCVGNLKLRQGMLFILLFLLSLVLHIMQYIYMKEYTEEIVKVAYAHVQSQSSQA